MPAMPDEQEVKDVRFGITVANGRPVWAFSLARPFYDKLPPGRRRGRFHVGKKMTLMFGSSGASAHGSYGRMWLPVGPLNTNLLPDKAITQPLLNTEGEFNAASLRYVFERPAFIDEYDLVPTKFAILDRVQAEDVEPAAPAVAKPDLPAPEAQAALAEAETEGKAADTAAGQPGAIVPYIPRQWYDWQVRRLLVRLRECLAARPDIEITIDDDRTVVARQKINREFK